ncbi:hypothetical protein SPRG_14693 [Saprolegnia parasitica CBS 223.65]|uniref:Uncharacterized protein n=1 Tax=Saprolegnia parasitica (strain CBS 223.65) TaxID=695850 RepID=A0A067BYB3_SAPPC|nr:hypothetical protein SPRG_14693 [Saprolegnia parasitica CBS 223.65]KDO19301.1 hypothetical protein SPRG_14693 [Saprolegnia parasitica CBS 223.65]|eukprot:XP_012209975.1 hypothetical protein SPRG_14693 [Saprolegnia parasitica CBS 223.65]
MLVQASMARGRCVWRRARDALEAVAHEVAAADVLFSSRRRGTRDLDKGQGHILPPVAANEGRDLTVIAAPPLLIVRFSCTTKTTPCRRLVMSHVLAYRVIRRPPCLPPLCNAARASRGPLSLPGTRTQGGGP